MSAREMFEKLGFRVNYKDDEILCDKKRFISDTDIIYINPKDKKIKELQKKAELGEHYKHLYSEVKKQKDELEKENRQLKEKLNCKEYFSSTMPEDTEFVILTKNNYDRQQKDLVLENVQLKKQKDDGIKYIRENVYIDYYGISVFREKDGVDKLLRMLGEIDD